MPFALLHRTHRTEGGYDLLDDDQEIPREALWLQAIGGPGARGTRACCPKGFGPNEVRLLPTDLSLPNGFHWELWRVSCTEAYHGQHRFWKFALWPVPNEHELDPPEWVRHIDDDIDPAMLASAGDDWQHAQMLNEGAFSNFFEPGDGLFHHVHIAVLLEGIWTPPSPQILVHRAATRAAEEERFLAEFIRNIQLGKTGGASSPAPEPAP